MDLYPLLSDRACINILKVLYDQEQGKNKGFTVKFSDLDFPFAFDSSSLDKLQDAGLIGFDEVEGDFVLSITQKGKEFIEVFDQLHDVLEEKTRKERTVRLHYNLSQREKRTLVLAYRIAKELGSDFIALKSLTTELYPRDEYSSKVSSVSRTVKNLEDLTLIERKKDGRKTFLKVTENGKKTIREQYLKGMLHL